MGEARRRKLQDSTYGRIPKEDSIRGLVISTPITIDQNGIQIKGGLHPQELRFALLYWDQLVWPMSKFLSFAGGVDAEYLTSCGVLRIPEYPYRVTNREPPVDVHTQMVDAVIRTQLQAFTDLETANPGRWALAQGENSFLIEGGIATGNSGVMVELHRAIPIPQDDVPLAEILEFKRRRRDELLAFRLNLQELAAQIDRSPDRGDAFHRTLANLDETCADLMQVGREWQFPVYVSDMKATFSIDLGKFIPAALIGTLVAGSTNETFGLVAASAVAALNSVAKMEIKGDIGFRSPRLPQHPFRYAYLAHQELL